jgi:hypothetical protein
MATTIRRFAPTDEARWRVLRRGYLDFYRLDLPEAVCADAACLYHFQRIFRIS